MYTTEVAAVNYEYIPVFSCPQQASCFGSWNRNLSDSEPDQVHCNSIKDRSYISCCSLGW